MLRTLLLSTLLLVVHGELLHAGQTDLGHKPPDAISFDWVRTANGWEQPVHWYHQSYHRPALHPFVVAGGQLLGSLLALAAFNSPGQRAKQIP